MGRCAKLNESERVYEKDGNRYVSFAPDVDHWEVRYVKA